ncbi:hypothetical protein [Hamadaea tsunoensis]|uniref:hypothetical protein n=1 Tax=Hamadaea tsunoensis TaxID=53368 RepID=UPI0004199110|nr:hypothetical protein [Hamadaea tsunoensis]
MNRLRALDELLLTPIARGWRRLFADRPRPHSLTVAACLVVAAAVSVAVWQADRAAPAPDTSVGQSVRVGVTQGSSIPEYAESSRRRLAGLAAGTGPAAETYALVSFSGYVAPDGLVPILSGLSIAAVYVRVPIAGEQTEIVRVPANRVPVDVVTGMDEVAARKRQEAADYADRLKTVQDADMTAVYQRGERMAGAEQAAYAAHCACAYAAVVRATPMLLAQLAQRANVRIVDPAPEVVRLDRAVFLPPLPEQRDRATPVEGTPAAGADR